MCGTLLCTTVLNGMRSDAALKVREQEVDQTTGQLSDRRKMYRPPRHRTHHFTFLAPPEGMSLLHKGKSDFYTAPQTKINEESMADSSTY